MYRWQTAQQTSLKLEIVSLKKLLQHFYFFFYTEAFKLEHEVKFHWRQKDKYTLKHFTELQPKILPYLKILAGLLRFSINHLLSETQRAPRQPLPLHNSMFFSREGQLHPGRRSRSIASRSRKQVFPSTQHLRDPQLKQAHHMSREENHQGGQGWSTWRMRRCWNNWDCSALKEKVKGKASAVYSFLAEGQREDGCRKFGPDVKSV